MQEHHYFASCALGWATAETQKAAIEKLVAYFRSDFKTATKNSQKHGQPGVYVWTCKVLAPPDAHYRIDFYAPQDVELEETMQNYVTYVTNKEVAYWTPTKDAA